MGVKILVLGSINGMLESAFKKVATLHAKNDFSFVLITGNLFASHEDGDEDTAANLLLSGGISIPVATYFTVGTVPLPPQIIDRIENEQEICENLHFLGKRSITKTSDGLRIVTLGGLLDKTIVGGQSKEQHLPYHTAGDATSLRGANKADILLTSIWPAGVWNKSNQVLDHGHKAGITSSEEVAELCTAIKPRYHFSFSAADFFYEREPFSYPDIDQSSDHKAVTRFISLAPFGNSAKAKAMSAFSLEPGETTATVPVGSTMSPFLQRGSKRPADREGGYTSRFSNGHGNSDHSHHGKRRRRERSPPPDASRCFFCLSNENLETHMVCSIGAKDCAYLTTAKGPLPQFDTFTASGLDFPGHQLIIPLAHEPTMRAIGAEGEETFKEMSRYRDALQAMVAEKSKHKLGSVTWEISRAHNIHLHWQFMPVPFDLLNKGLIEAGFKVEAENLGYHKFETKALGSATSETGDFLRLWLWYDDGDAGIHSKELVMRFAESFRFDLQFPRKVIAKLLNLEHRVQWKDVAQSTEEETADAERFKEAFKPWDPAAHD